MSVAITVDVMPAGRGDCLWVECHRAGDRPWRLLFDGGMPHSWDVLRERVEAVPAQERVIDLAVVSHIDADHIGGMLPLFATTSLGARFGDVWFNGKVHLPTPGGDDVRSVAQGESLVDLLVGASGGPVMPWNEAFQRGPVTTGADGAFLQVGQPDWPLITLLSPTDRRLLSLGRLWTKELERVRGGLSEGEAAPPDQLPPIEDVEALAALETAKDSSVSNGSSIAFLLEHRGANCLLTADAYYPVLGAALTSLANQRGGHPIEIDLYKVSHHGSNGNVTDGLLALTPAKHYVLSTDGTRFNHPDDTAMARIVTAAPPGATLWFNYRTPRNHRWEARQLRERYGYDVMTPVAGSGGVKIELEAVE